MAIAVIGFLVWGHHMFVTGQSIYAGLVFSVLSFLVAIPSAIKVFNWTATLYKGSISYEAPMLYALGFIGLFTMGGLTGLFLASLATDVHLNGHLLRRSALPLHHGGRRCDGVPGRNPLLVAEDNRANVSGHVGANCRGDHLHRIQSHVLSAIRAGLSRYAAALRRISGRIPGAQRLVFGGRFNSRRWAT